jgi:peptidyl-prolyl cis-trans isomerase D
MLQIMRSHKFFTVFLLGGITIIIIIVFIFWGIGPQQNPSTAIVAKVGNERITLAEYERAYANAYRRAWETYKDEEQIEKLNLKQRVIEELIDNLVLMLVAERAGIRVTKEELREVILNEPAFQINGIFSKEVYERRLKLNRMTPAMFENSIKNELLLNKIRRLISETTELSPEEKNMLESIKGDKGQLADIFLFSKRELAIKAYIEALKRQMDITINRDIIF